MSRSDTSTSGAGVDLPTLLTTAVASAAAAYVTSQLWAPGTLAAAAFTPVLVALLKEMLYKPAAVVTRAVPVRGVVRSAPSAGEPPQDARDTPEAIEARIAQLGEAPGASRPGSRRAWRAAVLTGLLGFLVAAVIITVPELVAGSSASGGGRDTTFFGGDGKSSTTTTPTTTTPTVTETTPLDETVTVAPPETVTVPPAETTTVPPAETTTAPDGTIPPDGSQVVPPAPTQPPPG